MKVTEALRSKISENLINWYRETQRDLPWRNMHNPYFTWISEVMLQQTQVDTVIPYYERFTSRFPTMRALAEADESEVLKHWEGLGYYSRARNLQAGVREVVEHYSGVVPKERSTLLKIKGIGPYTSGAILSIAYNLPEPAVDGNVMRVLSRVFEIKDDIAKPKTRMLFEDLLYELIPEDAASDFNQGLMELGALICKPKSPACKECPIQEACLALKNGDPERLPVKLKKTKQKKESYQVLLIQDASGRLLVHKRPEAGLLANLWEFPMVPTPTTETFSSALIEYMKETLGVDGKLVLTNRHHTLSHTFSHLKWDLNVWEVDLQKLIESPEASYRWVEKKDMYDLPFPVAHQKIREACVTRNKD